MTPNATARSSWIVAALLALLLACGEANPLLGEWEVDPQRTRMGTLSIVRQNDDAIIVFEKERVRLGPVELPVEYRVEADRVFLIRTDRDFEHEVDLLEDGGIRVHFPAGYTAVYRRANS